MCNVLNVARSGYYILSLYKFLCFDRHPRRQSPKASTPSAAKFSKISKVGTAILHLPAKQSRFFDHLRPTRNGCSMLLELVLLPAQRARRTSCTEKFAQSQLVDCWRKIALSSILPMLAIPSNPQIRLHYSNANGFLYNDNTHRPYKSSKSSRSSS
jgi:hypothetical protein